MPLTFENLFQQEVKIFENLFGKKQDTGPSQAELNKVDQLKNEQFVPVDFSLQKNEHLKSGYDAERLEKENKLVEKALEITSSWKYDISAQERTNLVTNADLKSKYVLLNDEKTFGDSKSMEGIKKTIRELEKKLDEKKEVSFDAFSEIEEAFSEAMKKCDNYIKSKNPWTPTGKRRKRRVRELYSTLYSEKTDFLKGKILYIRGDFEDTPEMSPNEIIKNVRNRAFSKQAQVDRGVKYGKDLIKGLNMENFFGAQREVNPAISVTSEIPLCMFRINAQFFSGDEDSNDSPIMKDINLCKQLKEKAVSNGIVNKDTPGRLLAGGLYRVKRDITGNPVNEEEVKKEENNKAWTDGMNALIEAKAAVKKTPDNEEAKTLLKQKEEAVLKMFIDKWEALEKQKDWWYSKNILKNPVKLADMITGDIEAYNHMKFFSECWESFVEFCDGKDYIKEYFKANPIMKLRADAAKDFGAKIDLAIKFHMHIDPKTGLAVEDAEGESAKLNRNDITDEEWDNAVEKENREYDDFKYAIKDYQHFNERRKILRKAKRLENKGVSTSGLVWQFENVIVHEDAGMDVKAYGEKKVFISLDDALLARILSEPHKYFDVKNLKENRKALYQKKVYKKSNIIDAFYKELGAFYYFVQYDRDNQPLNEEEAKKEEWNKKWLDFWATEDIEKKKEIFTEGKKRFLEAKLPAPSEIKEKGIEKLIKENPFFYSQLIHNYNCLGELKNKESALYNELIEKDENAQKYLKMLKQFVELINTGLASLHIVRHKRKEKEVKNNKEDNNKYSHLENKGIWRLKKPAEILTERKNGVINTLKVNEPKFAEEYEKIYKDFYDIKSEAKKQAEQ